MRGKLKGNLKDIEAGVKLAEIKKSKVEETKKKSKNKKDEKKKK